MRSTSLAAYITIRDTNLLSAKRWQAYDALYRSPGSLTHNELQARIDEEFYGDATHGRAVYRNNIVARLGELRDMGVVVEVGEKECSISGMTCIAWDVTDKLPRKLTKSLKPTRNQRIDAMGKLLKEMIAHLESRHDCPSRWQEWCYKARKWL